MVRNLIHIILFLSLILLSCDEKFVIVNCNDCLQEEPFDTNIDIKLSDVVRGEILINVYEGNIEDNIIIETFYTSYNETHVKVNLNKRYTFTAKYPDYGGRSTIVGNTAYPRGKYETNQCEEPCYYIYDTSVKLKLKYKNF